jgi:hypothetical protein
MDIKLLLAAGTILAAFILIKIWTGAMNVASVEDESLASIEKRHPYLPKFGAIFVSLVIAGGLFFLSLKFGKKTSLQSLTQPAALIRSAVVFGAILLFGIFDQWRWSGTKDRYKYFMAFVLGTLVTWILIAFKRAIFETSAQGDPFLVALGVTCIVIGWRFIFGPWNASMKATVLGTFLFWTAYAMLRSNTSEQLLATAVAVLVALIPVVIWCMLFLSYHRQRLGIVFLAFFAGMLSTVPILFYSKLMSQGIELNFFIFKVVPLSYGTSSQAFVENSIFHSLTGTSSIVMTTFITYLWVGIIEEGSKFWVLRYSSRDFFRSIDDTMQLAIIVAIGFAFAENLANPTYFIGFVHDYLMTPASPQWGSFIGSVVGRAVLTNMVHILSTGVLGFFFGLAFFASPLLRDQYSQGKGHPILWIVHQMLSVRTEAVYARVQIVTGFVLSIVIHGMFDFIVTLPEVLPGNPATVGALLGMSHSSFLSNISLTLVPCVLYVVGGLWLLMALFQRKEDMKEFGAVVDMQTFVSE